MAINFLNTVAVDDNVLFVDTINDRVGIGTASPDRKLEVDFTGSTYGAKFTRSDAAGSSLVEFANSAGVKNKIGYDAGIDGFHVGTASATNLVVKQNGNVGIGTTSPGQALTVEGNIELGTGGFIYGDSTTPYLRLNTAIGSYLQYGSSSWVGVGSNVVTFKTSSAERMRINHLGNVGIGETNPDALLHVRAATNVTGTIEVQGGKATVTSIGEVNAELNFGSNDSSATGGIGGSIKSITEAANGAYVGMGFYTARQGRDPVVEEAMRISNEGNVGIGITSPTAKLHITKDNTTGNALLITNSGSSRSLEINHNADGAGVSDEVVRIMNNGTRLFTIESDGNVGIGTDSPGEKLEVNGNIKIKNALLSNQENTDIDSAAAEVVAQVAHATYTAAFFDFVVKKGTNVRSGTVYACHNADTTPLVEFTETSTQDLGDTSDVVLSVDISGANMRLVATVASDDWSVKSLVKAI